MQGCKDCCSTCKYGTYDEMNGHYVCANDKSDCVAEPVEYDYVCAEFEAKK